MGKSSMASSKIDTIKTWHALVHSRDMQTLQDLLADEVVFHSPVVHTPQKGKAITALYLTGALHTLNNEHFRYEREIIGSHDAVLEFVTEIDGVQINGVDLIRWREDGRIIDFKVMVRPLKAVNALHQAMASMLHKLKEGNTA
jgi:SnoaL-like domain